MKARDGRGTAVLIAAGVIGALALAPSIGSTGGTARSTGSAAEFATTGPQDILKGTRGTTDEDASWDGKVRMIGDGSTSYTGPQPNQLKAEKLKPGQKPPQFVVFSWDGALENDDHLFSHFRKVAEDNNARMTFFLTGMYLLPESKRMLYHPPQHAVGTAAISFATDQHIRDTLAELRKAWEDGDEIGTHFNGHFCGKKGGGDWSVQEWLSETQQAYSFVENWKTNTGFKDLPALPFDYQKELVGGRAPCLEGQKNLLKVEKQLGWRYDASSPGDFEQWPSKVDGIWNFPLELLPYPDKDFQVLSMDFNFLYNQSGDSTQGDPAKWATWERETREGYLNGFNRAYYGSRAPLFIGNHFEDWNGGIYMRAVEDVVKTVCNKPEVRCVTFKEVADWMDAQDPKVLAKLRLLDPGQSPDWSTYITAADTSGGSSGGSAGNGSGGSGVVPETTSAASGPGQKTTGVAAAVSAASSGPPGLQGEDRARAEGDGDDDRSGGTESGTRSGAGGYGSSAGQKRPQQH